MTDRILAAHFVREPAHMETVKDQLGLNAALTSISPFWKSHWKTGSWFEIYDAALESGLKLITTIWPLPYRWREPYGDDDVFPEQDAENGWWDLSDALPFFDFLLKNDHYCEATIALNIIDQPYFPYGQECKFWSTFQMEKLSSAIQTILPGMQTYYDINDVSLQDKKSRGIRAPFTSDDPCYAGKTTLSAKAAGLVGISDRQFREGQEYNRTRIFKHLTEQKEIKDKLGLRSSYIYLVSTFGRANDGMRLPTIEELEFILEDVSRSSIVDGISFYTWDKVSTYEEMLKDHPELWPTIKEFSEHYLND